ncbi:MAG TPA: NAD(P)-dependent alcohol dehydrogenase, partial [Actinomycetota bacterium]|nr:NAD(P)-dependent alcohol dehydrogenase [Actinomycetota bacterium]
AGTVHSVGARVTAFKPGDRVFGFNEFKFGAHAEYVAVPENGTVSSIPAGMSFTDVAPSTEGAHYAFWIIKRSKVKSGNNVLVYGATGAIGTAAVQLLKSMGITVTAVCNTKNVELVRGLGAEKVVDYEVEDFTKDTERYDVVIDAVGKSSFGRAKGLLKPRGVYASSDAGPLNQNPMLGLVTPLLPGRTAMLPIPGRYKKGEVENLKQLMQASAFKPVVDRSFPLEEIVDAYRYVETQQKTGNVIITIVDGNG